MSVQNAARWRLVAPRGGAANRHRPAPLKARFARNKLAVAGLVVVALFFLFCFVGPFLYSTDQIHTDLTQVNLRPSGAHWLGTDAVGHDEVGRLMYGGKVSLLVGLAAGVLATVIGTLWGGGRRVCGRVGRCRDDAGRGRGDRHSRPLHPAGRLRHHHAGHRGLILILGLVSWLVPSRLVRAETLTLKSRDYVLTLRAIGGRTAGPSRGTSCRTRCRPSSSQPPSRSPTRFCSSPTCPIWGWEFSRGDRLGRDALGRADGRLLGALVADRSAGSRDHPGRVCVQRHR